MGHTCHVQIRIDNPFLLQLVRDYGNSRNLDLAAPFQFDVQDQSGRSLALLMDSPASPQAWESNTPACLADIIQALLRALRKSHTMADVIGLQSLLREYQREIDSNYREVQWQVSFRRTAADIDSYRLAQSLGMQGKSAASINALVEITAFAFTPEDGSTYARRCFTERINTSPMNA